MTREKYIKRRMASGLSRNQAAAEARSIQQVGLSYAAVDRLSTALSNVSGILRSIGTVCHVFSTTIDQLSVHMRI